MGKLNTILDYFKRKNCIKFIRVWSSIACHIWWEYDVNQRGAK